MYPCPRESAHAVLGGLLAGLSLLLACVAWGTRADRKEVGIGRWVEPEQVRALQLLDVPAPVGSRSELLAVHVDAPSAVTAGATPISLISVDGRVVESRTRAPIADVVIRLRGVPARTDRAGRFHLELSSERWRYGETVDVNVTRYVGPAEGTWRFHRDRAGPVAGESGLQFLFHGSVTLEPRILLVTWRHLVLRGKLLQDPGRMVDAIAVQACVPPSTTSSRPFPVGWARLGSGGNFRIDAWLDQVPASLRLVFATRNGPLLVRDVPPAELVSRRGALIELTRE